MQLQAVMSWSRFRLRLQQCEALSASDFRYRAAVYNMFKCQQEYLRVSFFSNVYPSHSVVLDRWHKRNPAGMVALMRWCVWWDVPGAFLSQFIFPVSPQRLTICRETKRLLESGFIISFVFLFDGDESWVTNDDASHWAIGRSKLPELRCAMAFVPSTSVNLI